MFKKCFLEQNHRNPLAEESEWIKGAKMIANLKLGTFEKKKIWVFWQRKNEKTEQVLCFSLLVCSFLCFPMCHVMLVLCFVFSLSLWVSLSVSVFVGKGSWIQHKPFHIHDQRVNDRPKSECLTISSQAEINMESDNPIELLIHTNFNSFDEIEIYPFFLILFKLHKHLH